MVAVGAIAIIAAAPVVALEESQPELKSRSKDRATEPTWLLVPVPVML